MNVPFDLSQVLFIATANTIKTIPAALLDRMEVITIPGYTHDEKLQIAQSHLLPKIFTEHGLTPDLVQFTSDALKVLISKYTREAGLRNLERKIAAICRAVAVRVVDGKRQEDKVKSIQEATKSEGNELAIKPCGKVQLNFAYEAGSISPIIIDMHEVEDILGPPIYDTELSSSRLTVPGVATGLAWTSFGGEILFVEATKMEGNGELTLTGQLGKVMKESARIAMNWVRTHAHEYGISGANGINPIEDYDVHIHFPAGAVVKDGPSAGITIVTALISLFTGKPTSPSVAMTGEITLRGLILPVGGVKDKVLVAHRSGIKRVILPKKNEKDLKGIPSNVKVSTELCVLCPSSHLTPFVIPG